MSNETLYGIVLCAICITLGTVAIIYMWKNRLIKMIGCAILLILLAGMMLVNLVELVNRDKVVQSITPTITVYEGTVAEKLRVGTTNYGKHKIKIETPTETFELDVNYEIYNKINKDDIVEVKVTQKIGIDGTVITEEIDVKNRN